MLIFCNFYFSIFLSSLIAWHEAKLPKVLVTRNRVILRLILQKLVNTADAGVAYATGDPCITP